jgi:hypothetical protein
MFGLGRHDYSIEGIGVISTTEGQQLVAVFRPSSRNDAVRSLSLNGIKSLRKSFGDSQAFREGEVRLTEAQAAVASGVKTYEDFFPAAALRQIAQAKTGVIKPDMEVGPQIAYGPFLSLY